MRAHKISTLLTAMTASLILGACNQASAPSIPTAAETPTAVAPEQSTAAARATTDVTTTGSVANVKLVAGTPDAAAEQSTACSIDTIDSVQVTDVASAFNRPGPHRVRGWIGNETAKDGVSSFDFVLQGPSQAYRGTASASFARPDVAEYLKIKEMPVAPGFELDIDSSDVPAGTYEIVINYKGMADKPYSCKTGRKVSIS